MTRQRRRKSARWSRMPCSEGHAYRRQGYERTRPLLPADRHRRGAAERAPVEEEIFGPVAPVLSFADEAEAISLANATQYGLVAYVYTNDLRRAVRVAEALEVGMVGLNQGIVSNPAAPFGGVKQSGVGREGGAEGIQEFLETKYVGVSL